MGRFRGHYSGRSTHTCRKTGKFGFFRWQGMTGSQKIVFNGETFDGRRGELLLDAALRNGVDIPYDCRAGHCGTCCVQLISGEVVGGEGSEPGIVHACQCRIAGDAVIEKSQTLGVRSVEGVVSALRPLSADVMEVEIRTERAMPYHAGQYAKLQFKGYPSRPFSITHPLRGQSDGRSVCFHVRRMKDGQVTRALGKRIKPGHRVELTGPFGAAYFRPGANNRLLLVATNTGFAPIWSIAVAALRENPERMIMIIAGGRSIDALYMGPALGQLARFPNVVVVATCSSPQNRVEWIRPGRPTDFIPALLPTDEVYACGAPAMVDSVKAIAVHAGAACYADPFMPATSSRKKSVSGILPRTSGWLPKPPRREAKLPARRRIPRNRQKQAMPAY